MLNVSKQKRRERSYSILTCIPIFLHVICLTLSHYVTFFLLLHVFLTTSRTLEPVVHHVAVTMPSSDQQRPLLICNLCEEEIPEQSFEDWFRGEPDHDCIPRYRPPTPAPAQRQTPRPTPHEMPLETPRERPILISPPTPAQPTSQHPYRQPIPARPSTPARSRRGPQTPPTMSSPGVRRNILPEITRRMNLAGNGQRYDTTIEEILALRSMSYCIVMDLERLYQRLHRERIEQMMEAQRTTSTAQTE